MKGTPGGILSVLSGAVRYGALAIGCADYLRLRPRRPARKRQKDTTSTFILCLSGFFMQTDITMPASPTPPLSESPDLITNRPPGTSIKRFLPRIGSPAYHVMLSCVAILILGPLGGISAAFMNFSIGFFIGGQVLAGILGSTVTLPYGPEGKHGANYMQTMAASVAGMCAMAVLVQAMVWLGLPEPPVWQLILYFLCIGMFGVG